MKLNNRKPFQMGAVLLAITMLVSYVVYSQRQVAPTIAPSSKSLILERTAIQMQTPGTSQPLPRATPFVAPGSKSMAPILTIPITNSFKATKVHVPNAPASKVFPGSKSAAIFRPSDVAVLLPAPAQHPAAFPTTTNTTASVRP